MDAVPTSSSRLGLRERKKQKTRETIERAALKLFAEQGYDQTTLAEIAEAADVAPRTIFAYFESKEDILFCDEPMFHQRLEHALTQRPPQATTVDTLRGFLSTPDAADARARLRRRIIAASEGLRASERARSAPVECIIAKSIARDLNASREDIRPLLAAASVTVAFTVVRNRLLEGTDIPLSHEETLAILDQILTFLHGGLEALQHAKN
jgi:AcrR family transcriptional regulator